MPRYFWSKLFAVVISLVLLVGFALVLWWQCFPTILSAYVIRWCPDDVVVFGLLDRRRDLQGEFLDRQRRRLVRIGERHLLVSLDAIYQRIGDRSLFGSLLSLSLVHPDRDAVPILTHGLAVVDSEVNAMSTTAYIALLPASTADLVGLVDAASPNLSYHAATIITDNPARCDRSLLEQVVKSGSAMQRMVCTTALHKLPSLR